MAVAREAQKGNIMAALPHEAATLEGIDEKYHALYAETDGKFVLDDNVREDTSGLKSAIEKERERANAASEKLKAFEGFDPEEYKSYKEQQQALKEKKLIDAGKFEELYEERAKPLKDELAKRDQQINELSGQVTKFMLTDKLQAAAIEAGAEEKALTDIIARARSIWQLRDGKPVAMTSDGVALGGKDGNPIEMTEWMTGLREDAPHLFKTSSGGGGRHGAGSNGTVPVNKKRSEMRLEEKTAYIREHGQEAYNKLPQ